jgi:hypothetical protein
MMSHTAPEIRNSNKFSPSSLNRPTAMAIPIPPPMHRDATPPHVPGTQRMNQRGEDARTTRADRMTERNGAAVDVHLAGSSPSRA